MHVLGIETSCDETAVAIVKDDRTICSHLVLSQLKEHEVFGGVVPEIAARAHLDHLDQLIIAALSDAKLSFEDLDGIAATSGPGLIGGVMVGMMAGKAIAASHDLPFVGVNHLEAHALTARLSDNTPFPYLLLLVSGGHTQLIIAKDVGDYECIGSTIDDALGECFDKSAKLMGLPYPGGPHLEQMALRCEGKSRQDNAIERFPLPVPLQGQNHCNFSFSGLKTAIRTHVDKLPAGDLDPEDIADLSFSFQYTVCKILQDRCKKALKLYKEREFALDIGKSGHFVVAGGVASNMALRQALHDLSESHGMTCITPPRELCSDNGAMVAWTGIERIQRNMTDALDIAARPRWPLDTLSAVKHAAR